MAAVTHYSRGFRWSTGSFAGRDWSDGRRDRGPGPRRDDGDYDRPLSALIECEIIPRLMAAHASAAMPSAEIGTDGPIDSVEVGIFAPLVMQVDADRLLAHIETILDRGVSVETVMVDLLAPAARLLGEYWDDDRCDFVDVTMGLWRLQEVVHEIAGRMPSIRTDPGDRHRALFASLQGDHHSFGTIVLDEVFRHGGWLTDRINDAETPVLLDAATADWFDIIGLTISCDCHIAGLASIIAALRRVSRNPRVCIMVGGAIFNADPDLATKVGADGTASDAKLALKMAGDLLRESAWGTTACN